MTNPELLEFLEQAKKLGLKSVEINGMKFEFASVPDRVQKTDDSTKLHPIGDDLKAEDLVARPHPLDELTDDEILYWSTPYGQELIEQRKKDYEDNVKRLNDVKE